MYELEMIHEIKGAFEINIHNHAEFYRVTIITYCSFNFLLIDER